MELSWSSFILEIINFIVLIWILKHFFYTPIKNAISTRKLTIQSRINQAEQLNQEAHQLQSKYENRLQDWEKEKKLKQQAFQQEIEEWKARELDKFKKNLEKEREKIYAREMQRVSSLIEDNAKASFLLAAKFAAQFLTYFADSALEAKMLDKLIADFSALSDKALRLLKNNLQEPVEINIQSSYPLNDMQKQHLLEAFKNKLGREIHAVFNQNADLIAGFNITIGSVLLQASVFSELKFFAEAEREICQT